MCRECAAVQAYKERWHFVFFFDGGGGGDDTWCLGVVRGSRDEKKSWAVAFLWKDARGLHDVLQSSIAERESCLVMGCHSARMAVTGSGQRQSRGADNTCGCSHVYH